MLRFIFLLIVASFIPIGNEKSTVRRLPWITFSILLLNVFIFVVTLPLVAGQQERMLKTETKMDQFIQQHQELLADQDVRKTLLEVGMISKFESDAIEEQLQNSPTVSARYQEWLSSVDAQTLREELDQKLAALKEASHDRLWYKWGLSPNGNWKLPQLITAAFLHGDRVHLFGNLIFLFAVAFSLEDLWGRGVFLSFYLLGAAAACIPSIILPSALPMIGASGAISATMGAFLFRLPKTKIKVLAVFRLLGLLVGKKRLVVMVPGYVFIGAYFAAQVVVWYLDKRAGLVSNVAYSAHFAGFAFGVCFAMMIKLTKYEELHINPRIEAMVSFSAAPAVTEALEALDKGDTLMAEKKLRSHLAREPNDTNAMMAAIQVFQTTSNFDRLNTMYARLIRHHLASGDKEAALYAYESLLSAFPENNVTPRIGAGDWISICEHLKASDLNREAAVEYERFVNACPDDPLVSRAAVDAGEVALSVSDSDRALRMFQKAEAMHVMEPYAERARIGIEECNRIAEIRGKWAKHPRSVQDSDPAIEDLSF